MSASTEAASVSASGGSRSRSPAGSSARWLDTSSLIAISSYQLSGRGETGVYAWLCRWRRHSRPHAMLFNTPQFVLGFLPVALAGFFLAGRVGGTRWALCWLVAASLFFYGWWNPKFVLLLAGSILANYWFGQHILGLTRSGRQRAARRWLIAGVAANLALLGWFKYANFLIEGVLRLHTPELDIFLPLAISFFTFQQIMFLTESRSGDRVDAGLLPYASFVAFFPHLIAGPIVRPREIMPQLLAPDLAVPRARTHRRGADDLPARPGEEARAGGYVRELLRCGLRRRGTRCAAELRRGVVCGGVLCAADLLRFLRLFRHGDRPGAHDERAVPGELRQPLQGREYRRLLAPLAHHAEPVPARERLYPSRRQPARRGAAQRQPDGDDAAGRAVARCRVEFRPVGRAAWAVPGRAWPVPLASFPRLPDAR